jgi:hypothetical protein
MSFGISIGDIVLCAQLAHHLFSSITTGRRRAPQDLKELQGALFGLYCALGILRREYETVAMRMTFEHRAALAYMIRSCKEALHELDNATASYREAIGDRHAATGPIRMYLRVQWKRIMWSFRGDTLMIYRRKLQTHTDSLNLLLNTLIWSVSRSITPSAYYTRSPEVYRASWNETKNVVIFSSCRSATGRIEESGRSHGQRLSELLQQASRFNYEFQQSMRTLQATAQSTRRHHVLGSRVSLCLTS